ncbi:basic salivary proline-rich protein 2-like [Nycticebus coucang]|uniref:basic salivary proline-rich protein 2-like n=1 Tax=Nycticebus coucang TaxID=9470 RepID=UPI00234CDAE2|nr:basic salivary proline-rich protein 2-like [Nycticebus coucang]
MRAARPAPPRLADTGGAGARREQSCPPPPPPPPPPPSPPPRPPPTRPQGPAALPRPPARPARTPLRSRGGSGRGVWNIESRRGLCSAGLRPEGGAAQRLRKKGGGRSSRRGGGDAGDPRALWPPAAAARLGSSRPRSQQVPRRPRGEGRARRRRACSLLAWRRGARRRRPAGASYSARSRALSPRLSSPGGRTRPPARGQDKERGGDLAGYSLPPLVAEPVPGKAEARAPSRGAAVPWGGFRPGPASGARLPIGLPTSPELTASPPPRRGRGEPGTPVPRVPSAEKNS